MESKQKKSKGFKFFIIIFIGIILFFSKKENQEKFIDFIKTSAIRNQELKLEKSIPVNFNIEKLSFYDTSILLWGENKLRSLNIEGDMEWEKKFNLDEPGAYFGKEGVFIYEKPIGYIYSLNSNGEIIEKCQLNKNIYNVKEVSGNIFVHIKEKDKESINILDNKGNLLGENLVENRNILTYCMDEKTENYAFSTLNLNNDNLKSDIEVYGMEGELLWSTSLDNEIIMYMDFINQNDLIVLSDKGIYLINDSNILWKKQFQIIKDIFMGEEKLYILHGNTLESISFDGRTIEKSSFTEEYKKILSFNKYIVLYGDNHIIGLRDGEKIFKYESDKFILNVLQGVKKLIVVYEDRIDIISL